MSDKHNHVVTDKGFSLFQRENKSSFFPAAASKNAPWSWIPEIMHMLANILLYHLKGKMMCKHAASKHILVLLVVQIVTLLKLSWSHTAEIKGTLLKKCFWFLLFWLGDDSLDKQLVHLYTCWWNQTDWIREKIIITKWSQMAKPSWRPKLLHQPWFPFYGSGSNNKYTFNMPAGPPAPI